MNDFNVLLAAATNGAPSGSLFDALFARYIAPQESWRELESPPPLTFTANGQPLLDYRIYGNTVQTGTPTPENPIMPIGCGERTENLWDFSASTKGSLQNGGTVDTNANYSTSDYIPVTAGQSYTFRALSGYTQGRFVRAAWYDSDKQFVDYSSVVKEAPVGSVYTNSYTAPNNASYARVSGFSYLDSEFMFVEGSTSPDHYIPYGYKLPILSNSTVTDIYLGEVQTTRRIKKLVLTGKEDWHNVLGSGTQSRIFTSLNSASIGMCTHYVSGDALNPGKFDLASGIFLRFNVSGVATTRTEWIDYLAQQYANGTPITVWYVLAEPETGIVNEPLMKIKDYADTVSMEQAGVSIPTTAGETIIDYNPSETPAVEPEKMYIKYKP